MKLRKFMALMLVAVMSTSVMFACGSSTEEGKTETSDNSENSGEGQDETEAETSEKESNTLNFKRMSVHDPSIVKDGDTYYIFGSHIPDGGYAKSTDLQNWEAFYINIRQQYEELFKEPYENWTKSSGSNIKGNLWAPDVIYNETMGKWCMYMSLNGNNWQSVIVLLTADNIEGPYEYAGNVIYSGFYDNANTAQSKLNEERVAYSDIYDVLEEGTSLGRYDTTSGYLINAIDPNVMYDDDGSLWMTFGSWSGGIFQIKLDPATGLRDYSYTYTDKSTTADAYYGYKIAGGYYSSGEAPYIIKADDYYFLFVTYGGLSAAEGYNMRVFRSESINGPYVDQNGTSAIYTGFQKNYGFSRGLKLMGNNLMTGLSETKVQVAQGHNSAFVDEDGKIYLVYHTRFADPVSGTHSTQSEVHQVRVHQMYLNSQGWLVASPFEYTGETIADSYTAEQIAGSYDFIINKQEEWFHYTCFTGDDIHKHNKDKCSTAEIKGIAEAEQIKLTTDGKVTGAYEGTWTISGNQITIDLGDRGVFYGVLGEMPDETAEHYTTMFFTAAGENLAVWGTKR